MLALDCDVCVAGSFGLVGHGIASFEGLWHPEREHQHLNSLLGKEGWRDVSPVCC